MKLTHISLGALALVAVYVSVRAPSKSAFTAVSQYHGPQKHRAPKEPTQRLVWVAATEAVRAQLNFPASAFFGKTFDDYQDPRTAVRRIGERYWRVSGWVEGKNEFGGTSRLRWQVMIWWSPRQGFNYKEFAWL